MEIGIEKELKYQLIEADFNKFQEYIETRDFKKKECIEQVNYYFDTNNFLLKKNKITMRLRRFGNDEICELTIKVPNAKVSKDTTDHIKIKDELTLKLKSKEVKKILSNDIKDYIYLFIDNMPILKDENIISNLNFIGELRTKRFNYVIKENSATLSFDISEYLNIKDYEVECEAEDIYNADIFINNIFQELCIAPINNVESKSTRFINKLIKNTNK